MNSRVEVLARVRGAVVGSLSGAVSVAAHGIGGGAMPPSEGALVLLLAACATVGVAVATLHATRRDRLVLIGAITSGQLIGHTTLAVASEHTHSLGLSAPMIAAHVGAIAASAVAVRAAERACLRALAAVTRILLTVLAPLRVDTGTWSATPLYRAKLSLWLLVSAAAGTRGPPVLA
ncbi:MULTISPECIES: hypothetical protein [unclassified Rhodococcus (in: high G+C Gram-positive bacteria)]|uniref:hypothetical protein n=1 Tax=unclassified Rhodococcus (in: high G+C Gram-positive bacteria) TaxID=192944 RepID=UPI00163ADE1F|nr:MULTISPECIES: hypothetical protein [unclassified Rhodococcus (in: high G+C Gram-positive bacteria)]MBC2637767.1 hypothetical protein [Rhodococcus sp. 3A]MBC2897488.1 hypothetical protein [Rhodococcus sp. 4CII]